MELLTGRLTLGDQLFEQHFVMSPNRRMVLVGQGPYRNALHSPQDVSEHAIALAVEKLRQEPKVHVIRELVSRLPQHVAMHEPANAFKTYTMADLTPMELQTVRLVAVFLTQSEVSLNEGDIGQNQRQQSSVGLEILLFEAITVHRLYKQFVERSRPLR